MAILINALKEADITWLPHVPQLEARLGRPASLLLAYVCGRVDLAGLKQQPWLTTRRAATALGMHVETVQRARAKLEQEGLVTFTLNAERQRLDIHLHFDAVKDLVASLGDEGSPVQDPPPPSPVGSPVQNPPPSPVQDPPGSPVENPPPSPVQNPPHINPHKPGRNLNHIPPSADGASPLKSSRTASQGGASPLHPSEGAPPPAPPTSESAARTELFLKGWSYFYTQEFGTAPVLSEPAKEQALDWVSRLPNRVKLHDIIAVARTAWAASKEKSTQYDRFKAFRSASDLTFFLRNYEKIKGQIQFEGVTDQDWLDWEEFKKTLLPTEELSLSV